MDNNKRNLPTQGVLAVRILIGGYLVYLAQSLIKGRAESSMKPAVLWAFVVFFTIVGIILLGIALKNFYKGEYVGGKADITAEEDEIVADVEVVDAEAEANADDTEVADVEATDAEVIDAEVVDLEETDS